MLAKGTIVEVYEDPLTMKCKEGNARIVEHVVEFEHGVNLYKVNFIGDDPDLIVFRTVAECPICVCCDPLHPGGKDQNCRVHGMAVAHVG